MNSPWISLAKSGKRLTPFWIAIPASLVILIGSILIGQALFRPLIPGFFGSEVEIQSSLYVSGLVQMLKDITELGPAIFLLWLLLRVVEGRGLSSLGLGRAGAISKLSLGAFMGFSLMAVWGIAGYLVGALVLEEAGPTTDSLGLGMLFVFFGVLVQTSAEELVFRGWLLQVLSARWGPLAGIVLVSLTFAFPHALNDDITQLAIVNILLLSIFFGLVVWHQQSLWTLIGFHWFYNWTQFSVLGLDVTADEQLGGALINLAYTNNVPFFTSGVVAEDGPIMTVIAIVAIIVIAAIMYRARLRQVSQ